MLATCSPSTREANHQPLRGRFCASAQISGCVGRYTPTPPLPSTQELVRLHVLTPDLRNFGPLRPAYNPRMSHVCMLGFAAAST
jgi:hypothetical protein